MLLRYAEDYSTSTYKLFYSAINKNVEFSNVFWPNWAFEDSSKHTVFISLSDDVNFSNDETKFVDEGDALFECTITPQAQTDS